MHHQTQRAHPAVLKLSSTPSKGRHTSGTEFAWYPGRYGHTPKYRSRLGQLSLPLRWQQGAFAPVRETVPPQGPVYRAGTLQGQPLQ